jgi:ABC-type multidrug transport system ATPase subunit
MIDLAGISKFSLKNVNLRVKTGEFVVVRGKGGSGKTTLVRLVHGDIAPDEGTVRVLDTQYDYRRLSQNIHAARRQIGFVSEGGTLLENKSVLANLEIPLKLLGNYHKRFALSVLERLELSERIELKACELSCSGRQLLKIALCTARSPLLLLVDEVLQGLDSGQQKKVHLLLEDMNTAGATVLYTTAQDSPPRFTRELNIIDGKIM